MWPICLRCPSHNSSGLSERPRQVFEIDRVAGAPIDVLVNGRRIASGEVVVIDEEFGVRITEIIAVGDR